MIKVRHNFINYTKTKCVFLLFGKNARSVVILVFV